jgi:hypothetical protein
VRGCWSCPIGFLFKKRRRKRKRALEPDMVLFRIGDTVFFKSPDEGNDIAQLNRGEKKRQAGKMQKLFFVFFFFLSFFLPRLACGEDYQAKVRLV